MMTKTGNLPNLVIIGAMKGGTTSLHAYLNLHPDILMSRQKELNFFLEDENGHRSTQWYRSQFKGKAKIYGEASPNYTNYPLQSGVPERMSALIPAAKLIYIVRNPVERAISHYVHSYTSGIEDRTLEDALAVMGNNNRYTRRSQYFFQLKQYLEYFSPSNILIVTSESLARRPVPTMQTIFRFLGVDDTFALKPNTKSISSLLVFGPAIAQSSQKFNIQLHQSSRKRRMKLPQDHGLIKALSAATEPLPIELRWHARKLLYWPFSQKVERPIVSAALRHKLLEHLMPDVEQLRAYTNNSFDEWNLSPDET